LAALLQEIHNKTDASFKLASPDDDYLPALTAKICHLFVAGDNPL
jgi:hypothetical protein